MRILVSESGDFSTLLESDEFDLMARNVSFGNVTVSALNRACAVEPGADCIGPDVVTYVAADYLLRIAAMREIKSRARSALAKATVSNARAVTDITGRVIIGWEDRDQVGAVRSRMYYGLAELGQNLGRPLRAHSDLPGQSVYDGLFVLDDIMRLPTFEAIDRAAQYNTEQAALG